MKSRGTEASGTAAVAISGDAHQPVLTNPTFLNISVPESASTPPTRLRLLPPDIPDFIGRQAEIELLGVSSLAANPRTLPVRAVITGKPGVGKTALAIHASYLASDSYSEGDLYVDLRGADENPASPEEVMGRLMRSLGVPEEDIPGDPLARLDSYRKAVADRPLVIVLDNASDERQVRPLIPAGNSALVLITSRSQLRGLEGFRRIDLDVFPSSMSLDFLRRVTGEDVVEADQASAEKVVEACGHLPLALRIAANRLASTRNMRMSHLAQELTEMRDILGALEAGDLAVRAAFNLSYRKLGKGARNAFKRLSCVPGEDFGSGLCSSLMRCDERQAGKLLAKLAEVNLIEHTATYGRYRFHDLLKVYAQEKFDEDDAKKKSQAIQCMLDWLKGSTTKAQFSLIGHPGVQFHLENSADIDSVESATAWAREELSNAAAAISLMLIHDSDERAVGFSMSLSGICEILGEWQIWEEVLHLGIPAARRLDDPLGEIALLGAQANLARYRREFDQGLELASRVYSKSIESGIEIAIASSANQLACLFMDSGRHEEGIPLLEKCLEIYQRLGLEHEIGKVLYNLGTIHRASGETRKAIEYFERDLQACLASGDESGAAETLNTLAIAHFEMGELKEAENLQRDSLEKFKKIGNPHKVSMVINDLGVTLKRLQKFDEALDLHLDDVELCRAIGSRSGEALAQANVAETLHSLGDPEGAEGRFNIAVSVLRELGDKPRLAHVLIAQIPLLFSVQKIQIAEEHASQAVAILLEYGQKRDAAGAHQLIAREYALIGEYEKSLSHAKESIQLSEGFTSPYFRAVSYIIAVEQCLQLHLTEEARNFGEALQQLVLENPNLFASLGESLDKALKS
ncbi:tetratricopeptide repeat protein [Streptomyces sp. NPDC049590]|uniref:tetratricopeptide repeat protein n=1 Tax=Streptomyces sp. NPDC049590 TaxID=3154834 RepID=UPI0034341033